MLVSHAGKEWLAQVPCEEYKVDTCDGAGQCFTQALVIFDMERHKLRER